MLGLWCDAIRQRNVVVRAGRLASQPCDSDSPSMEWQRTRGMAWYEIRPLRRLGRNFALCVSIFSLRAEWPICLPHVCLATAKRSPKISARLKSRWQPSSYPWFTFSYVMHTFPRLDHDVRKQGGQSVSAVGSLGALRRGWHHRHWRRLLWCRRERCSRASTWRNG